MKAATGWTMRIEERAWREWAGSEKSVLGWSWNSDSVHAGQLQLLDGQVAQHTSVIANRRPLAAAAIGTVAQHAEVDAAVGGQRNGLDDGRGEGRQQQQTEGDEEQYG